MALSCAYTLVVTDAGRAFLVPRLVRLVDDAIQGTIAVRALKLRPGGGVELSGVRVVDPDGDEVLRVEAVRVQADLRRLLSRTIGVHGEIEQPTVTLKREQDGSLSLAHAFLPTHPSTKRDTGPSPWTVRITHLSIRGGAVRYVDTSGRTAFDAEGIGVEGRTVFGPAGARVDASLRAAMTVPERAPVSLDVLGSLREGQLRVRTLRAEVGDTALDGVASLDLKTWRGEAALLVLAIGAREVKGVAPKVPLADDVVGTIYAESNGARATAALELRPRNGGGTAEGSAAVRLPPEALEAGGTLSIRKLDLARVLRGLPATDLALDARGHAAGSDLASLRGALALSLGRSTVRGGRVGPGELRATADRGRFDVSRLELTAPGATVRGQGRWSTSGALGGRVTVDAPDLAEARRNVALLTAARIPEVAGAIRIDADLSGTERVPVASLRIDAPALRTGSLRAQGVSLTGNASGPLGAAKVALQGSVARLDAGQVEARALRLDGRFDGRAVEVALTGELPAVGTEALTLRGAGTLSADRRRLELRTLTVGLPGDPFELERPATILLDGGSVDRLALVGGDQRITLTGGVGGPASRRTLDAALRLEALDLARLPKGLLPPSLGLAGLLGADVTATGTPAAPRVEGRVTLAAGSVRGLDGLSADGRIGWDGGQRRARVALQGRRAAGGTLELEADLPAELGRAPAKESLRLDVVARGWPVPELLRAARVTLSEPVDGVVAAELHAGGRVGAPTLRAGATLDGGRYGDFDALKVVLRADDPGAQLTVTGSLDLTGARAIDLDAGVPLRLADALRDPRAVALGLRTAPLKVTAAVPGLDLVQLAGRAGVPEQLRGRLQGKVELGGTALAPRGTVALRGTDLEYAGYQGVVAELQAGLRDAATTLEARVVLQGEELLRGTGSIGLAVERFGNVTEREHARVEARLDVARADLRGAARGAPVALTGTVAGFASLAGTLGAPVADLKLDGSRVEVEGKPLGDVHLEGHVGAGRAHAALQLTVTTGGTLDAALDLESDLSVDELRAGTVRTAPARARVVADQLDLGFLPAAFPGIVRSASGKLGADLVASGPLARMVPKGTVELAHGALSVAEVGDWTDVVLSATLSDEAFRLKELSAKRRGGKMLLTGSIDGVGGSAPATLQAALRTDGLVVPRGGQDLATVDIDAQLKGKVSMTALDAELTIPSATVRLPNRLPRRIQPLDTRTDIVVGVPRKKAATTAALAGGRAQKPYHARVQVLVPGRFFVKGDNPRVNIELRADVIVDWLEQLTLEGDIETVRGMVEPIGGRIFDVKRGRVRFTGDPMLGMLEIQAQYDNPQAKVTVSVTGTVQRPDPKLSSEPAMDESQIALLIATGRTELKAGTGGVSTISADEAGKAALGALATQAFKEIVSDKLPIDTVALDSSQLRAGTYVTDKIYVGYTRRFDAKPEQGENTNEVRVEYQISRGWTFQSRYGDAQSGGASLLWSHDY